MTETPSAGLDPDLALELSQHEVNGRLHTFDSSFDSDRRTFLKTLGGGILVCLAVPRALAQESGRGGITRELPQDLASWLHVGEDGRITVFTGKVEFGQNIRTSLAQQIAEELHVDVGAIDLVMGDTDRCPWDAGTFGSRTTPTMGPQLRKMAAIARTLLVDLTAQRWGTDRSRLTAEAGRVRNPETGASLSYGELSKGQNLVKTSAADVPLTPAPEWKVAGTPVPKANGRDFVTGRHVYTSDLTRPGLLHGLVLRRPSFKATLASVDKDAAEKLPGVTVVRDGDFLGVAAPDRETASRAVMAIKATWNEVPGQPSNQTLFAFLRKNAVSGEQGSAAGSVDEAMASADVKLARTYTVEYIAHVPLETDRKRTRLNSSPTEISPLSLPDALPICGAAPPGPSTRRWRPPTSSSSGRTPSNTSLTCLSRRGRRSPSGPATSSPCGPARSARSRCATSWPTRSTSRATRCASSCPTPAPATVASTRATPRSRPRASRRRPASQSR